MRAFDCSISNGKPGRLAKPCDRRDQLWRVPASTSMPRTPGNWPSSIQRTAFRGPATRLSTARSQDSVMQSAIGAPYAHTTAPLRRLVDRSCPGHLRGAQQWNRDTSMGPGRFAEPARDHGVIRPAGRENGAPGPGHGGGSAPCQPHRTGIRRRGDFRIEARQNNGNGNGNSHNGNNGNGNGNGAQHGPYGVVQIAEPAVTARCDGEMESGTKVRVKLLHADIATRQITFELLP